jgi:hypothetical protein
MCNNACVYNLPETVYYKAAKKLLHQGQVPDICMFD